MTSPKAKSRSRSRSKSYCPSKRRPPCKEGTRVKDNKHGEPCCYKVRPTAGCPVVRRPPCPEGSVQKPNKKGAQCCYKKKRARRSDYAGCPPARRLPCNKDSIDKINKKGARCCYKIRGKKAKALSASPKSPINTFISPAAKSPAKSPMRSKSPVRSPAKPASPKNDTPVIKTMKDFESLEWKRGELLKSVIINRKRYIVQPDGSLIYTSAGNVVDSTVREVLSGKQSWYNEENENNSNAKRLAALFAKKKPLSPTEVARRIDLVTKDY